MENLPGSYGRCEYQDVLRPLLGPHRIHQRGEGCSCHWITPDQKSWWPCWSQWILTLDRERGLLRQGAVGLFREFT